MNSHHLPNSPRTQHRSVRISGDDWADLDEASKAVGSDGGSLIKEFIRWYLRRPGAKLPERPARTRGSEGRPRGLDRAGMATHWPCGSGVNDKTGRLQRSNNLSESAG
jgi:hypothetical protein